jgi:hypothetical protein
MGFLYISNHQPLALATHMAIWPASIDLHWYDLAWPETRNERVAEDRRWRRRRHAGPQPQQWPWIRLQGGKRDTGIVDRDRPCLPRCVATSCIENRVSGELVGDHAYACCLLLLDEQHFERRWMNWDLRVLNPHYLPKCQRACFDFCCFLKSSPLLGSY